MDSGSFRVISTKNGSHQKTEHCYGCYATVTSGGSNETKEGEAEVAGRRNAALQFLEGVRLISADTFILMLSFSVSLVFNLSFIISFDLVGVFG